MRSFFMASTKQFIRAATFLAVTLLVFSPRPGDAQESSESATTAQPLKLTGPPWLGVRMSDDPARGVHIAGVAHRSPAEKAGLEAGDRIVRAGTEAVKSAEHLSILIRGRRVGDSLPLSVDRDGETVTVNVELEEMPERRDVLASHLVGRQAPDFEVDLIAPDGGKTTLDAFEGKPMVLEFWATWCAPCREMSKNLTALKKKHGEKLHVVGVSAEDQEVVESYVRRHGTGYVMGHDADRAIHDGYFVDSFPTIVLIDAKGKVAAVGLGIDDFARFEKQVDSLLDRGE